MANSEDLDLSQLLRVLTAIKNGDLTARMPVDQTGVAGEVAAALNEILVGLSPHAATCLDCVDGSRQLNDSWLRLKRQAMQREFVATVSHELRTPIAAIQGFAATLRLGGLDDADNRLEFVRIIEKHADKLGWLVEDILTLNAMESGKLKPAPEEIALREFVERLVEGLSSIAARRQISVSVEIDESLRVVADQLHLSRILQNLLDKAIKYNVRSGAITIGAKREGRLVRLFVRDSGVGIAAHEIPLIFQPFYRSENAKAMQVRGSGLGLYIIKSIVEANGGEIWAQSELGKGTEFQFTLPEAGSKAEAAPPAPASGEANAQLAERPQ